MKKPRLEVSIKTSTWGGIKDDGTTFIGIVNDYGNTAQGDLSLKDVIRLHRFLGRAIEFLSQKPKRKAGR